MTNERVEWEAVAKKRTGELKQLRAELAGRTRTCTDQALEIKQLKYEQCELRTQAANAATKLFDELTKSQELRDELVSARVQNERMFAVVACLAKALAKGT